MSQPAKLDLIEDLDLTEAIRSFENGEHPLSPQVLDAEAEELMNECAQLDPNSFSTIWTELSPDQFSELTFEERKSYLAWIARRT